MKKVIFCAFTLVVFQLPVRAQSEDEKAVSQAVENLRKAMVDGNRAELESIADAGLSYGHSSGLVQDKAEFVENIVNGNSDFVTITLQDQTIHVSGDVAIVRHKLLADTNDKGKQPGSIELLILTVWKKNAKGQWKLLARQAVHPR